MSGVAPKTKEGSSPKERREVSEKQTNSSGYHKQEASQARSVTRDVTSMIQSRGRNNKRYQRHKRKKP